MSTTIKFGLFLLGVSSVLVLESPVAAAQDRMPPIAADKLTDAQKKAIEPVQSAR